MSLVILVLGLFSFLSDRALANDPGPLQHLQAQCGQSWVDQNQAFLGALKIPASDTPLSLAQAEGAVESLAKLTDCPAMTVSTFSGFKETIARELGRRIEENLTSESVVGPGAVLELKLFEWNIRQKKAALVDHSASELAYSSLRKSLKGACVSTPSRSLSSVEDLGKEPSLALSEAMSAMERVTTQESTKAEDQKQLLFANPDLDWSALALQDTLPRTVANQVSVREIDYFHSIANDFAYFSGPNALHGLAAYLGKPRKSLLATLSRSLSKAAEPDRKRWKEFAFILSDGLKGFESGEQGKQDLLRTGFHSKVLFDAAQEYESLLLGGAPQLVSASTLEWIQRTDSSFQEALSRASLPEWKGPYKEALLARAKSLEPNAEPPHPSDRAAFFRRSLAPQLEHCLFLSEAYPEERGREVCSKWHCVTAGSKGCGSDGSILMALQTRYVEQGALCPGSPRKSMTRQILDRLPRFKR
jgi:hypothetical protein